MKILYPCFAAALASFLLIACPAAFAAATDYTFEPVQAEIKNGSDAELAVKLIHKPTGKAVADAVVFRTRLDMSPDKMETMTATHEQLKEEQSGIYRFKAKLMMAGGWALKLMAKVQGEPETVQGVVIFQAKD